jgi:hypothetical protein
MAGIRSEGGGWWYGGPRELLSVAAGQNPDRARMVGGWNQKRQHSSGASALGLAASARRASTRASWRDERFQLAPRPRRTRLRGLCAGGDRAYPLLLLSATLLAGSVESWGSRMGARWGTVRRDTACDGLSLCGGDRQSASPVASGTRTCGRAFHLLACSECSP